jgi:predicted Zn-dependent peptidase
MYSSRPNQVFREERRETYGAHAVVLDRGTHTVVRFATTVETPQLGDVLDLLFDELARLGDAEALTDEEVERARRLEIATEIARWDDSATLVRRILDARVRGERPSPSRAIEALAAVDRAAVAETARHWLAPHRLAIVAVGQSTWMFTHPLSAPGGYAAAEP